MTERLTAPVYATTSALAQYPGPLTSLRYAIVDGVGMYRWHANDVTAHDGEDTIAPSGGAIGRWKLSVQFAAPELVELVSDATSDPEPDTLVIRDENGLARFGVEASGDTTGSSDRAKIATVLASSDLTLVDGETYYLDQRLDIPAGRTLNLGRAIIRPGSSWDNGTADDRTYSVLRVAGSGSGTVATSLAATEPHGSQAVVLSSESGLSVGTWLRVFGTNSTVGFAGQTDSVSVSEIVKVDSTYGGTTTAPLAGATSYHHDSGHSVVSWDPCEGVRIIGGIFDFSSTTTAVCIEITHAYDVEVIGSEFRCFSRAAIDGRGAKRIVLDRIVNQGDCNGFVFLSSCHNVRLISPIATGAYGRQHATGVTRHQFWFLDHCVNCVATDVTLTHVPAVLAIWGGLNCGGSGWNVEDVDCVEVVNRALAAERQSGMVGIIFEGGPGPINEYTCFGFGSFMRDGVFTGVHQPSLNSQKWCYAHDLKMADLSNLTVTNKGQSALDAGGYLGGILLSDFTGTIKNINASGTYRALETNNFLGDVIFDSCRFEAYAGVGTFSTQYGFHFDHQASGVTFKASQVHIVNYQGIMQFGASFAATPDYTWLWKTLRFDDETFDDVVPVRTNSTVVRGTVGRLQDPTATGYDAVIESTGPNARQLVFLGAASNSWTLAALGNAMALHTGTAAKRGDLLVADALGNLVVSTAPPSNSSVFMCRRASAGGRVHTQRIGAVPPFGTLTASTSVVSPEFTSATGTDSIWRAPTGQKLKGYEAAVQLFEVSDESGTGILKMMTSPAQVTGSGNILIQPGSGGYMSVRDGSNTEIFTIISNYLRFPTNTPTGTIPAGHVALGCNGTDLVVRIGTQNYSLNKTAI